VALAARVEGFTREALEAALTRRTVVKTTIMRHTLHLVAASEYPAYAQLSRQALLRTHRNKYPGIDEKEAVADLRAFLSKPRTNAEIREHLAPLYPEISPSNSWYPISFARTLLPLVQLPPAGFWKQPPSARFVIDPRPLPAPADAAELAVRRYLGAFGPASRRDIASWAGATQADLAEALERLPTMSFLDEKGTELLDLPRQPRPPGDTRLPVRFLARWDQALIGYSDRDRILPPELYPLKLGLAGDQTVTVDGRIAASWIMERGARVARLAISPHVEIPRRAVAEIREEGLRTARFCAPESESVEVGGV
jgi:hypothetical protein